MDDNTEILKDTLDNIEGTVQSIYTELTRQGEPSIKGLLLEQENRGERIEKDILPHIQDSLVEIKKAILVSAIIIAKPTKPEAAIKKAYTALDKFLEGDINEK